MRVWTDGERHAVLSAAGLFVSSHTNKLLKAQAPPDGFERGWMAVGPGFSAIWAGARQSKIGLHDINGYPTRNADLDAIAVIDGRRVLAVMTRDKTPELVIAEVPDRTPLDAAWARSAQRLHLDHGERVAWPSSGEGAMWNNPPWRDVLAISSRWSMNANRFGIAAVDQESGLVVVRSDSAAIRVLRVPCDGIDAPIEAAVSPYGVLVAHGGSRAPGVLNHFALDGRHLAGRRLVGMASELSIPRGEVAIVAGDADDHSGRIEVRIFDLPSLEVREVIPTELSAYRGSPTLHAADRHGELVVLVGDGHAVRVLRHGREGWSNSPLGIGPPTRPGAPARPVPVPPAAARPTRARHPVFGEGDIVEEIGLAEQRKLVIDFPGVGRKILLARAVEAW
jgi:hypothetical protein